jgi:hypothetical protein
LKQTLLNVQTVEPLRHADVSILINITVPGQLLPAFSQIFLFRDDLFEDFPLVSVQHFVLVLVEIDETPSGRLLLLRRHPRQSVEVLGVVIFQHPSVQELHEVFEENDFFVVGTALHGPVHVSELVALRRAVLDRSPRNVLSGVFVHAEAISRRFVALDLKTPKSREIRSDKTPLESAPFCLDLAQIISSILAPSRFIVVVGHRAPHVLLEERVAH